MAEGPGLFRRARRRHKLVVVALGLAVLFLVVNVVLALGQWDGGARSFRAGSPVEVDLVRGEERMVYLGAQESESLNFDFYASDFTCEGRSPAGTVTELERARGGRLLDIWNEHSAVGSFVADDDGTYVVSCEGREDAELLFAHPARFTVGWASPMLALFVLMMVVIIGAAAWLVAAVVARVRGPRPEEVVAGA